MQGNAPPIWRWHRLSVLGHTAIGGQGWGNRRSDMLALHQASAVSAGMPPGQAIVETQSFIVVINLRLFPKRQMMRGKVLTAGDSGPAIPLTI